MNAKLLPEQKLFRFAGWILLFLFAWPAWIMRTYIESGRYGRAPYDALSDTIIVLVALTAQIAWIGFLFWLVFAPKVAG